MYLAVIIYIVVRIFQILRSVQACYVGMCFGMPILPMSTCSRAGTIYMYKLASHAQLICLAAIITHAQF